MRWLAAALVLVVVLLQYRIWLSSDGVREVQRLQHDVAVQRADNDQRVERNRQLAAEVRDLKTGMDALEERARSDLGMIASHETFYQVVPALRPAAAPGASPVAPPSNVTADAASRPAGAEVSGASDPVARTPALGAAIGATTP